MNITVKCIVTGHNKNVPVVMPILLVCRNEQRISGEHYIAALEKMKEFMDWPCWICDEYSAAFDMFRIHNIWWDKALVVQLEQVETVARYIIKDSNGVHLLNDSYDSEEEAWADVDKVIRYREHGDYKIYVVQV